MGGFDTSCADTPDATVKHAKATAAQAEVVWFKQ
jgi:hypothetical protein